jgi:hypothetical protein
MAKRQPKIDKIIDGVRVRVFATRSEFEVLFNDGDIEDDDAYVLIYPKFGDASIWAAQGRLDYRAS